MQHAARGRQDSVSGWGADGPHPGYQSATSVAGSSGGRHEEAVMAAKTAPKQRHQLHHPRFRSQPCMDTLFMQAALEQQERDIEDVKRQIEALGFI